MEIKDVLEKIGLKGKKVDVYLATLELGSASVIEIAKKAQIKRTTCYNVLLDLIDERLISQITKGKRKLFISEDPKKIIEEMKNKERLFSEILPQLQSIHNIKTGKPKIKYFEGREGMKDAREDTLKHGGNEILAIYSYNIVEVLGKEFTDSYIKRRIQKGFYTRTIAPTNEEMIKSYVIKDQEQRRSTKLINAKDFPFSIEILIYGNNYVSLVSAKEEIGIIIEGSEIHKTMKLIFELIWKLLPEIKVKERYLSNKEE